MKMLSVNAAVSTGPRPLSHSLNDANFKLQKYRLTTFFSHILPAVLIGLTFLNTGNDASMVRANVCFVFGVLIFIIYLGKMSVTLTSKSADKSSRRLARLGGPRIPESISLISRFISVPNELHVLKAEHFNRWYSLLPYYLSMIIIEIPMQVSEKTSAVKRGMRKGSRTVCSAFSRR